MKILLAPTYELAKDYADHNRVDATVEAEYGEMVIEGETLTLAHHGSRSNNPAPCNDPRAVKLPDNATVLVSHLDLDTLGGLMALQGKKPDNPEFWKAAEYIDVNGPHHIHEFPQEIQDKLNAYYAFENESRADGRPDREHIQDVTESVNKYIEGIDVVLDDKDYSHNAMIDAGRKWEQEVTKAVEDRLVSENENVRVFSTNGPFCNGSYYSPSQEKIIPAVVSYNEKFNSITLSFADGGKELSARDIVQSLWGPEAGGRDGIAGSPRGQEMTRGDLEEISEKVSDMCEKLNRPEQGEESLGKAISINFDDNPVFGTLENKNKVTTARMTIGVMSGYNVKNPSDERAMELAECAVKEVNKSIGRLPDIKLKLAMTEYLPEWGCPEGGEKCIQVDIGSIAKGDAALFAMGMQAALDQSTVTVNFGDGENIYITRSEDKLPHIDRFSSIQYDIPLVGNDIKEAGKKIQAALQEYGKTHDDPIYATGAVVAEQDGSLHYVGSQNALFCKDENKFANALSDMLNISGIEDVEELNGIEQDEEPLNEGYDEDGDLGNDDPGDIGD